MRLAIFGLAATMVLAAFGVWKYAGESQRVPTPVRHSDPPVSVTSNAAIVPPMPEMDVMEPIAVLPEAAADEPFEPRVGGTTEEMPLVEIPALAVPRFDGEDETKLRMPRADEAFDWVKMLRTLDERSVLMFFEPRRVLPMPDRIVEESDAPQR